MTKETIIFPVFFLVLLSVFVWFRMLFIRARAMRSIRVRPEKMKSQSAKILFPEEANIPAEHFTNLFEVPVLFYLLTTFLYISETVTPFYIASAFVYVLLRYVHSFVALSYNRVTHRFIAYFASCIVLWGSWGIFGLDTIFISD